MTGLRQRLARATLGGRDAHGAIPFDQKHAWSQGYAECKRQMLAAADKIDAAEDGEDRVLAVFAAENYYRLTPYAIEQAVLAALAPQAGDQP